MFNYSLIKNTSYNNYSNITSVEEELKELCSKYGEQTLHSQTLKGLKESIIDFLHRLKDKHPSSICFILMLDCIAKNKPFGIAFRVMDFMRENNLNPSEALIEEYRQSKTTKILNQLPSKEELKEKIGMDYELYALLKKVYRSKIIKIK